MVNKIVTYKRVSTDEQGESGLGLEAQQTELQAYCVRSGCEFMAEFVEVASGKSRHNRPELAKAIAMCKKYGYMLVVTKLDRLSRKTVDTLNIYEELSNNVFVLDNPNLDDLKLGIMATVSQNERQLISSRTKAALKAKYAKEGESWHDTHKGLDMAKLAKLSAIKSKDKAIEANKVAFEIIKPLREQDKPLSFQKIADHLNVKKIQTAKGAYYNASQVKRVYDRGIAAQVDS